MGINDIIKEDKYQLNENLELKILTISEGNSSWSEIFLVSNDSNVMIGKCFINEFSGLKEWIDFNDKCILFYRGNLENDGFNVVRVFDINKMQNVDLSIEEIEQQYGLTIKNIDEISLIKK